MLLFSQGHLEIVFTVQDIDKWQLGYQKIVVATLQ